MKQSHKVRIGKLSEFRPQTSNANKHTERGLRMLDDAMSEDGYVAPATATADGEVIDGSARLERAFDKFENEAIIIEHDGTRPVIAIRTDIPNAKTKEAKRIALRANRIAEADLDWDAGILAQLKDEGVDLSGMFTEGELGHLSDEASKPTDLRDASGFEGMGRASDVQVRPVLLVIQASILEKALRATGETNRAEALMIICESYLGEKGQFNGFTESEVAALVA